MMFALIEVVHFIIFLNIILMYNCLNVSGADLAVNLQVARVYQFSFYPQQGAALRPMFTC